MAARTSSVVAHRPGSWPVSAAFMAAGLLVVTGVALYLLTRPPSVLFVRAADALGMWPMLYRLRVDVTPSAGMSWVAWSLPFSLFVVAYLIAMRTVWDNSHSPARRWWFWAGPVIALASEFGQAVGWVPGRFDLIDVTALSATFVIGVLVLRFPFFPLGERKS